MKEAELKKYEIDLREPTAISVNPGHSELYWMDEKQHFLLE